MKKPSKTYLRRKADKLFSELIRSRGLCAKCGRTNQLQCAHIVSRRYLAVRYDEANAFCLCISCHKFYTEHPVEWLFWVQSQIGWDAHQELQRRAIVGGRPDYPEIIARLQERLEAAA